jgi:hypothetical protein
MSFKVAAAVAAKSSLCDFESISIPHICVSALLLKARPALSARYASFFFFMMFFKLYCSWM